MSNLAWSEATGEFIRIAALSQPVAQLLAMLVGTDFVLAPPGHRTPQLIGLTRCEACGDDSQLHHLFLKDRHAIVRSSTLRTASLGY